MSLLWPKVMWKKYSQLACSPLLRKSPSSGFSVLPVFSHILWISDMHSLGFRRKKRRPFRIARLCWFQSHRFCRFWLLMAENAYMLIMKNNEGKVTTISQKSRKQHKAWVYQSIREKRSGLNFALPLVPVRNIKRCVTHHLGIVCLTACVHRKI